MLVSNQVGGEPGVVLTLTILSVPSIESIEAQHRTPSLLRKELNVIDHCHSTEVTIELVALRTWAIVALMSIGILMAAANLLSLACAIGVADGHRLDVCTDWIGEASVGLHSDEPQVRKHAFCDVLQLNGPVLYEI